MAHYHVIETNNETLDTAPAFAREQDAKDYAVELARDWAVVEPFVVECDRDDCSYSPEEPRASALES